MLTKIALLLKCFAHKRQISKLNLQHKGQNVQISLDFQFDLPENISIGDNVYIGPGSFIDAFGGLSIGSGTIIGPKLTIYTANHHYKEAGAIPYDDMVLPGKVQIGENIWIGGNVIILPGVTIGEGCVVGAGSVVTKDFPAFQVIAGNPAKVIGMRDESCYMKLKQQRRIYLALKEMGEMEPHAQD